VRYRSRSQAIRSALDRSSETLLTFALREVERVFSDQSRTNREINQLWDILDDPHVNNALGRELVTWLADARNTRLRSLLISAASTDPKCLEQVLAN
jgi:hypothetical protein